MPDIRLGMSCEELLEARQRSRLDVEARAGVPFYVLGIEHRPDDDRSLILRESRRVLGHEAVVRYYLHDEILGAVTVTFQVFHRGRDTFATWATVEREIARTLGPPALRTPSCDAKSCGDPMAFARLRPEDVADGVGPHSSISLHSIWVPCPMRLRLIARSGGVYLAVEDRLLEESMFHARLQQLQRPPGQRAVPSRSP